VAILSILSVRVVIASAGYFAVSIGALFVSLGAGSWFHGFRPTLLIVGFSLVLLTMLV